MTQPLCPVPAETVERVRALAQGEQGERRAAEALALNRLTILRICAGWPVSRGTLLQLERALPALPVSP